LEFCVDHKVTEACASVLSEELDALKPVILQALHNIVRSDEGLVAAINANCVSICIDLLNKSVQQEEDYSPSRGEDNLRGLAYTLVESISPGFPKSIVLEVSQCLKPDQESDGSETIHVFKYLSCGVYCCVLYEEWLKLIADYYADESSVHSMNALKLKSKLEDFHCGLSPSVCQPPLSVIHAVLDSATPSSSGTGTSSFLVEITLDHFRRTLFLSETVRSEVQRLRN
jgi:hypothetical protein